MKASRNSIGRGSIIKLYGLGKIVIIRNKKFYFSTPNIGCTQTLLTGYTWALPLFIFLLRK